MRLQKIFGPIVCQEDVHSRGQIAAAPLIQLGPGLMSSAFLPNGVPHIYSESSPFLFFR